MSSVDRRPDPRRRQRRLRPCLLLSKNWRRSKQASKPRPRVDDDGDGWMDGEERGS